MKCVAKFQPLSTKKNLVTSQTVDELTSIVNESISRKSTCHDASCEGSVCDNNFSFNEPLHFASSFDDSTFTDWHGMNQSAHPNDDAVANPYLYHPMRWRWQFFMTKNKVSRGVVTNQHPHPQMSHWEFFSYCKTEGEYPHSLDLQLRRDRHCSEVKR